MPTIYAPRHLRAGIEAFEANVVGWINRSCTYANRTTLRTGAPVVPTRETLLVEEWFGEMTAVQLNTLRANLTHIRTVLTNPNTSIRIVDAPAIADDRGFYAQVRVPYYNPLRPNLSIEVADAWMNSNVDTKVNTFFHELSHRILGTLDVGVDEGYLETMYGIANAQSLAAYNPNDALRNAENYGYFIALCNGFVNQAP